MRHLSGDRFVDESIEGDYGMFRRLVATMKPSKLPLRLPLWKAQGMSPGPGRLLTSTLRGRRALSLEPREADVTGWRLSEALSRFGRCHETHTEVGVSGSHLLHSSGLAPPLQPEPKFSTVAPHRPPSELWAQCYGSGGTIET